MAVYKVIQDVEAEDKLLGPLTLKGFIYALIAGTCAFINFKLLLIASPLKWLFILMFAMPMILFGVLASPLGRDQPTEVWLLSRLRFFLKPRRRIWDQEGLSELVTVTVPKKEELRLTKDLSQTEVQSRLMALATTLDTRGWAVKNVDVNLSSLDTGAQMVTPDSDRLVGAGGVPKQMAVVDVHAADDIMDEKNNPTAKKFDNLMKQAEDKRKRHLLASLKGLVESNAAKPQITKTGPGEVRHSSTSKNSMAGLTDKERRFLRESREEAQQALETKLALARTQFNSKANASKTKPAAPDTPAPKPAQSAATQPAQTKSVTPKQKLDAPQSDYRPLHSGFAAGQAPVNKMTTDNRADKLELAQSGNAFSVATLSQLANRGPRVEQTGPGEVTISLH